jgi:hypothetical protein
MTRGRDIDNPDRTEDTRPGSRSRTIQPQESFRDEIRGDRADSGTPEPKDREPSELPRRDPHHPGRHRDNTAVIKTRRAAYVLADRDLATLEEIGKFRIVDTEDLARFRFEGDEGRMNSDLARLTKDGLIRRQTITDRRGEKLKVAILTSAARRLLESRQRRNGVTGNASQRFYADLKKPAEVFHDAAIYRMYQDEAARIRSEGGRVRRIVLDYELKKAIYRPLAKARAGSPKEYEHCQQEIARQHGLTVVDGKIPLPDLRIEYETAEGGIDRLDLELATGHYKGAQMLAKLRAGFHLYIAGTDKTRGGVVRDERELTAGILSI